jgi:hypothetical protein
MSNESELIPGLPEGEPESANRKEYREYLESLKELGAQSNPDYEPVVALIKNRDNPDGKFVFQPKSILKNIKGVIYDHAQIKFYQNSILDIDDPDIKIQYFLSQRRADGKITGILYFQSLSLVIGQYKSRKGFWGAQQGGMLLSKTPLNNKFVIDIPEGKNKILIVDTEQNRSDVATHVKRIIKLSGCRKDQILVRYSRDNSIEEKEKILEMSLMGREDIIMVFVDGTADFVTGVNEEDQARRFLGMLLKMSTEYNTHIQGYIHSNKGAENSVATGKLGGEWMKKASATFFIKKEGKTSNISPDPAGNRKKDWDKFVMSIKSDPDEIEENETPFIIEGEESPLKKSIPTWEPSKYPLTTHYKIIDAAFNDITAAGYTKAVYHSRLGVAMGGMGVKGPGKQSKEILNQWAEYYLMSPVLLVDAKTVGRSERYFKSESPRGFTL